MFDLRKIFDLRKTFAVPKNFLKSKIYCTTKSLLMQDWVFRLGVESSIPHD